MTSITPLLNAHQESTSTRIEEKIETAMSKLCDKITDGRTANEGQTKKFAEYLEKSLTAQQSGHRALISRMEKLEKQIGMSYDRDEEKTLLTRLDEISFTVEELLERAKDPNALGDGM